MSSLIRVFSGPSKGSFSHFVDFFDFSIRSFRSVWVACLQGESALKHATKCCWRNNILGEFVSNSKTKLVPEGINFGLLKLNWPLSKLILDCEFKLGTEIELALQLVRSKPRR